MKQSLYFASIFLGTFSFAYESMHNKTPVGRIIVLDLPERTALEATTDKSYFSENNGLFRKLFRYINQNNISMTTPVEADINPGKMRFFVGNKDLPKDFKDSDEVKVKKLKKQKVVSIGIRGGYSEKRYHENLLKLKQWLDKNPKYERCGDSYGVYWNGPFIPGPFKRSEIHIPIRKTKLNLKSQSSKSKTQPTK